MLKPITAEDARDIAIAACFADELYDKVKPCNRRFCFNIGGAYVVNRTAVGPQARLVFDDTFRFYAARIDADTMEVENGGNIPCFEPQFDVYCFGSGWEEFGWAYLEMFTPIREKGHLRDTYDDVLRRRVVVAANLGDYTVDGDGLLETMFGDCGYDGSDPRGTMHNLPFRVPYQWELKSKVLQLSLHASR